MRVSTTANIEGSEVLYTIGTIRSTSAWHGDSAQPHESDWREKLIADLTRIAEDLYADAIVSLRYGVDEIACLDEGFCVKRRRMIATAVAVKLVSRPAMMSTRERSAA